MPRGFRWRLALLVLLALLAVSQAAVAWVHPEAPAMDEVTIGMLAFRPKPLVEAQWQPLADYLDAQLPTTRVRLQVYNYSELEAAVAQRRVDFVFTNPAHYVLIARNNDLTSPLATMIRRVNGEPLRAFGGVALARNEVGAPQRWTDLAGLKIATPTRKSLGGYMMQHYQMVLEGAPPPGEVRVIETGMPHDRAVEMLLAGEADVAFVRSSLYESMVAEGRLDADAVQVVARKPFDHFPFVVSTRLYPEWPFTALPHVDDSTANGVAAALLSIPLGGESARQLGIHGFSVPLSYEPVEALMRELRLPPFDAAPSFTLADVWQRYRVPTLLGLLLVALILVLFALLLASNRRLSYSRAELGVAQLRQEQHLTELERSNAELEQFAYAVSHDMRQPLRMISGHLQVLERSMGERLSADERESMRFAVDGAQRMDRMIVALLDYSRVGRMTEPKAWLVSRESLDEALAFLAPEIDGGAARVEVRGEWPQVHASRDELTRLLQNLIGNALKYVAPGRSPQVEVVSRVAGRCWRVEVRDNGIGIDTGQRERLFKVFSRLHDSQSYPGSGVGLALCRKIVEHHGGVIGVESAGAGHGSTFWFEWALSNEGIMMNPDTAIEARECDRA